MRQEKSALLFGLALGFAGLAVYVGVRRRSLEARADRLVKRMSGRLRELEGTRPALPQP